MTEQALNAEQLRQMRKDARQERYNEYMNKKSGIDPIVVDHEPKLADGFGVTKPKTILDTNSAFKPAGVKVEGRKSGR